METVLLGALSCGPQGRRELLLESGAQQGRGGGRGRLTALPLPCSVSRGCSWVLQGRGTRLALRVRIQDLGCASLLPSNAQEGRAQGQDTCPVNTQNHHVYSPEAWSTSTNNLSQERRATVTSCAQLPGHLPPSPGTPAFHVSPEAHPPWARSDYGDSLTRALLCFQLLSTTPNWFFIKAS